MKNNKQNTTFGILSLIAVFGLLFISSHQIDPQGFASGFRHFNHHHHEPLGKDRHIDSDRALKKISDTTLARMIEIAESHIPEDAKREEMKEEEVKEEVNLTEDNFELVAEFTPKQMKAGSSSQNAENYLNDHFKSGMISFYNVKYNHLSQNFLNQNKVYFNSHGGHNNYMPNSYLEYLSVVTMVQREDWAGSAYYIAEVVLTPILSPATYNNDPATYQVRLDRTKPYTLNKTIATHEIDEEDHNKKISIITDPFTVERELGQDLNKPETLQLRTLCRAESSNDTVECTGYMHQVRLYQILY